MSRQDSWRRERMFAAATSLAFALVPILASHPALAADSAGQFVSNCSDALIEPLCLSTLGDAADIADDAGDACIPKGVTSDQEGHAMLDYLRQEVATHPETAGNDSMDEEEKAAGALWPCRK